MLKADFLENKNTEAFCDWLSQIIDGSTRLDFMHSSNGKDETLESAKKRYCWPHKRIDIPTPNGTRTLQNSNLSDNQSVLSELSNGLRNCLNKPVPDEELLKQWIQAILVWGGVYTGTRTGKGNRPWLEGLRDQQKLSDYLKHTLNTLAASNCDDAHRGLPDLRSNAGLTKVYSLSLTDFIIYDSRVAAALAWLVSRWSGDNHQLPPEHLRFACMRANTNSKNKPRSPNEEIFPYFAASGHIRNHYKHATWNIRANWVLRKSLDIAVERNGKKPLTAFHSLRELEAALFMMGENLKFA